MSVRGETKKREPLAFQDKTYFKDRWRNEEKSGTRGRCHTDRQKKLEVARRRWWMIGGRSKNRNKDKGQWRESKGRKNRGRRDGTRAKVRLCSLIAGTFLCYISQLDGDLLSVVLRSVQGGGVTAERERGSKPSARDTKQRTMRLLRQRTYFSVVPQSHR